MKENVPTQNQPAGWVGVYRWPLFQDRPGGAGGTSTVSRIGRGLWKYVTGSKTLPDGGHERKEKGGTEDVGATFQSVSGTGFKVAWMSSFLPPERTSLSHPSLVRGGESKIQQAACRFVGRSDVEALALSLPNL